MTRYLVRWQADAPEGCSWPLRQVASALPTEAERRDGIDTAEPIWEAEVTAPSEHCALAAIWGLYSGEPHESQDGSWSARRLT